jgi:hypothetical protein
MDGLTAGKIAILSSKKCFPGWTWLIANWNLIEQC